MERSRLRELMAVAAAAGMIGSFTPAEAATYVYTYTGPNFLIFNGPYTEQNFIQGSFTIDLPGDNEGLSYDVYTTLVQSFSFSDGVQQYTDETASFYVFNFSTDSDGIILDWFIYLVLPNNSVLTTTKNEGSQQQPDMFLSDLAFDGPSGSAGQYNCDIDQNVDTNGQPCAANVPELFVWTWQEIEDTGPGDPGSGDPSEAPEPASLLLTALGLGGLALVRRRRAAVGR